MTRYKQTSKELESLVKLAKKNRIKVESVAIYYGEQLALNPELAYGRVKDYIQRSSEHYTEEELLEE